MILRDAVGAARAGDDGGGRRVREGELERGRLDRHPMALCDGLDALDPGDALRRRLLVLAVAAAHEYARAIRASDDDAGVSRQGRGHEALQGALVIEQRV